MEQTVLRRIDPRVNLGEDSLVVYRSIRMDHTMFYKVVTES